jgi:hypothetical protein
MGRYFVARSGHYTRWMRVNDDGSLDTFDSNLAFGWHHPSMAPAYLRGAVPADLATVPEHVRASVRWPWAVS